MVHEKRLTGSRNDHSLWTKGVPRNCWWSSDNQVPIICIGRSCVLVEKRGSEQHKTDLETSAATRQRRIVRFAARGLHRLLIFYRPDVRERVQNRDSLGGNVDDNSNPVEVGDIPREGVQRVIKRIETLLERHESIRIASVIE